MAKQRTSSVVNLVDQHRKMAEEFLKNLIALGQAPKKFSGVMCPKFGNYILLWQFTNNKLSGTAVIHVANVDGLANKMKASKASVDWLKKMMEVQNNNDTAPVSDTPDSV